MKTILVDAYYTFVLPEVGINKDMQQLLDTYPNKKIVLTNANDQQMIDLKITNLPYEFFTLKHNPDKIDPLYFITMLKQFNLQVEDVIYFEHDQAAVKSAESLGIKSYFYDQDKNDLIALKNFLDSSL